MSVIGKNTFFPEHPVFVYIYLSKKSYILRFACHGLLLDFGGGRLALLVVGEGDLAAQHVVLQHRGDVLPAHVDGIKAFKAINVNVRRLPVYLKV